MLTAGYAQEVSNDRRNRTHVDHSLTCCSDRLLVTCKQTDEIFVNSALRTTIVWPWIHVASLYCYNFIYRKRRTGRDRDRSPKDDITVLYRRYSDKKTTPNTIEQLQPKLYNLSSRRRLTLACTKKTSNGKFEVHVSNARLTKIYRCYTIYHLRIRDRFCYT